MSRFDIKKILVACSFFMSASASAEMSLVIGHCPAPAEINVTWQWIGNGAYTAKIIPPAGWHQVAAQWATPGATLNFHDAYAWVNRTIGSYMISSNITCVYRSSLSSDDLISIAKDNPNRTMYTLTNANTADSNSSWYYYNPSKNLAKCVPMIPNAYSSCGFASYQ